MPVVLLLDVAENILTGDGPESSMYITASLTQDSPKVYLAPTNRIVKQVTSRPRDFPQDPDPESALERI